MYLKGLGTAHPARRYTKADCWAAFQGSEWFNKLDRRSRTIAELVLGSENGIEARRLALESLDEVFRIDPDTLHARFVEHAPRLAAQAAERALANAGTDLGDIDGVVVSTCTGYLCPGLTGYVVEELGLRTDVNAFDLVGHGCAAALPNWQLADALLESRRCRNVLSVCVEVSSAAMYLDNDPGVLISACLFGDGAGAAVLGAEPGDGSRRVACKAIGSLLNPAEREALRFEQRQGMLRNVLTRPVPKLAAQHAEQLLDRMLDDEGLERSQIGTWIWHAGGRDVLAALRNRLGLSENDVRYSSAMLREFGNLSSAFVYFVLEAALADEARAGWWWMSSFGAGFSCHGALLEVA
ncbi:MAG TPA: 3-oxoacyl-[acyl-carrier-protein] synthase III C-terminal domain-containing protein [Gammaproteobacteria bacterium]|nr:3-oxoacyl-[acyl-carrier-protein] synthase III C-terminal domain-containing protein [Gammaproteobacteria bacterium]